MTTTPAMPELHRDQIIDLISPLSKNSADHDIEFANRVIAALQSAQPAAPQGVIAWAHPDGRVVPASTKEQAIRDGGAMASSLAGYTIPCVAAQPAAAGVSDALRDLVAAIDNEMSAEWNCSSYHPSLPPALEASRAILALRPQAVPMTDDTELLEFMFQHRAVVSLELEGGWDAELLDESGSTVSAASGFTPRDALRRLKAHHGITAPAGGEVGK